MKNDNVIMKKIAESQVETKVVMELLLKMPVQKKFKLGFAEFLRSKKILDQNMCSSFVLGVAFAEYVNENVDPNSDDDMKDYYVSKAILANPDKLPIISIKETK